MEVTLWGSTGAGFTGVKLESPWDATLSAIYASERTRGPTRVRCFNVDHYLAKLIATAAIVLAQFGMEDTRLRCHRGNAAAEQAAGARCG